MVTSSTPEGYNELLDMYAEMLRVRSDSGSSNSNSESTEAVVSRLFRSGMHN